MTLRTNRRSKQYLASPVSDILDKALFSIAFLGGITAIMGMKFVGFAQIYASLVAIGFMATYVIVVWTSNRLRVREDHIGDNVYYLGFLYTLTSLGYALWDFTGSISGHTINSVIANFGIALSSTIVGVWLRVLMNQMRSDPAEVEREARVELAEASNRVRAELASMVADLNDFRRQMLQVMRESIEETSRVTQEAMAGNAGKVGETTERLLERVDAVSSEYAENANKVNQLSRRTAESLQELTTKIDRIEAPTDLITSRLLPAVNNITDITTDLRKHSEAESNHARVIAEALMQIEKTMPDLVENLKAAYNVSGDLGDLNTTIATLQERLSNISEAQMAQTGVIHKSVDLFSQAIREHTENMVTQHGLFEETVAKFSAVMEKERHATLTFDTHDGMESRPIEASGLPPETSLSSRIDQPEQKD